MALCSLSAGTLLGVAGTLALPWGSKLNKEENAGAAGQALPPAEMGPATPHKPPRALPP